MEADEGVLDGVRVTCGAAEDQCLVPEEAWQKSYAW